MKLPGSMRFRAAYLAELILLLSMINQTAEGSLFSGKKIEPDGSGPVIKIEFEKTGSIVPSAVELPSISVRSSGKTRVSTYGDNLYRVIIQETDRGFYSEINGEIEYLKEGSSCLTLRIIFPVEGVIRKWYHDLDGSEEMNDGSFYSDTKEIKTVNPPDGSFNGKELSDGGYGDPVGKGRISFYPLCAINADNRGEGLGIDMSLPLVYRLAADRSKGLIAEFDMALSPYTFKFPDRAFFRLVRFEFEPEWGMRAALEKYYSILKNSFCKRVITEGIWLPFTPLRSVRDWEDFGFAFHETSWGSSDSKEGTKTPSILSDKGTGVLSFQYTEPWDVQVPVRTKSIPYDSISSGKTIPDRHREYLAVSATADKNGLLQARRLNTPWFKTGWAVSITTNCDPDLPGFNRYQYILKDEINPALRMNVDGIYFDSMEWNWHNDLNYNEEHFKFTDYPLTFSQTVAKPAIWNFTSEFEFMKKISDEMHLQGKLAMGNGHAWNPFAASNLDLFGAEISWYSSGDHDVEALDFKRAISFQKPIVFLLNEGLNDKAFTEPPYPGYNIYFEKMMAYGFFPSFFSVDASNDPYWQDKLKIETGRPFFKKYIPLIKEISDAGWQPVTYAKTGVEGIRIERFGTKGSLYFTVRNNSEKELDVNVSVDNLSLGLPGKFNAFEMSDQIMLRTDGNVFFITVPALRTKVVRIPNN